MKPRIFVLSLACVFLMAFSLSPDIIEPPVTINAGGLRFDGDMFSNNITFYNPLDIKTGTISSFTSGSLYQVNIAANPDMPEGANGSINISSHSEDAGDSSTVVIDTNEGGQVKARIFMNKDIIGLNSTFGNVDTNIFGTSEESPVLTVNAMENSVTIDGPLTVNGAVTFTNSFIAPKTANLTISSTGEITVTGQKWVKVDTFSGAANDELCTISGGVPGQEITLSTASSARDVTISNDIPCNIVTPAEFTFDHVFDRGVLQFDGVRWVPLTPFANNK